MKQLALFPLLILLALPATTMAQKKLVDKRDQATGWYVPVKFFVTTQGTKTKTVDVRVFKDNQQVEERLGTRSKFTLNLDLDNDYTVIFYKDGYRSKSVYLNTSIPEELVRYPAYECTMDLEPAGHFSNSDPFYLDFPSAIIRWDQELHGFYPQVDYLKDIQSKMAMLQVQMDPRE